MNTWLKTHLGFLALLPMGLFFTRFRLHHGGILPYPWERLFDWAGEVVAMTYLACVFFVLNYGLVLVVAGILDRCPRWHTVVLIGTATVSLILLWPGSFTFPYSLCLGLIAAFVGSLIYLLSRTIVR
ncbi:hypothetical protein IT570_12320, partial [Candidatus Sumerlaeota bacterium]|nr:hypothetical protein [Candidatus Sumerlaeota bacterium]